MFYKCFCGACYGYFSQPPEHICDECGEAMMNDRDTTQETQTQRVQRECDAMLAQIYSVVNPGDSKKV